MSGAPGSLAGLVIPRHFEGTIISCPTTRRFVLLEHHECGWSQRTFLIQKVTRRRDCSCAIYFGVVQDRIIAKTTVCEQGSVVKANENPLSRFRVSHFLNNFIGDGTTEEATASGRRSPKLWFIELSQLALPPSSLCRCTHTKKLTRHALATNRRHRISFLGNGKPACRVWARITRHFLSCGLFWTGNPACNRAPGIWHYLLEPHAALGTYHILHLHCRSRTLSGSSWSSKEWTTNLVR